jgi:hypothetical protein
MQLIYESQKRTRARTFAPVTVVLAKLLILWRATQDKTANTYVVEIAL